MAKFHYVLMAAVVVLFVFGLFGGTDYANERDDLRKGNESTDDYLASFNPGMIGDFNSTSRTVFHDDSLLVKEESPNKTVKQFESLEVQRGVFSEPVSKSVKFDAVEPEAVHIEFTVDTAQTYGDLVFLVNGNVEETIKPEEGRRYTVSLSNVSEGDNILLMAAENPGYVFWSPARYQLSDVEVILEDSAVSKNTETFRVYDYELSSFDTGTVEFFVQDDVITSNPLRIDINGNRIFERTPQKRSLPYDTDFSKYETDLRQGENTVSIYTGQDSEYTLSNINIDLKYYQSTARTSVDHSFEIPLHRYQLMDDDILLQYHVEKIGVAEDVEIEINDRILTEQPGMGWNTIELSKEDLKNGENMVKLSTEGSYEITEFLVFAED